MNLAAEKVRYATRLVYQARIAYFDVAGNKLHQHEIHQERNDRPVKINIRQIEADLYLRGYDSAQIYIYEMPADIIRQWTHVETITVRSPVRILSPLTEKTTWAGGHERIYDCTPQLPPEITDQSQARWY